MLQSNSNQTLYFIRNIAFAYPSRVNQTSGSNFHTLEVSTLSANIFANYTICCILNRVSYFPIAVPFCSIQFIFQGSGVKRKDSAAFLMFFSSIKMSHTVFFRTLRSSVVQFEHTITLSCHTVSKLKLLHCSLQLYISPLKSNLIKIIAQLCTFLKILFYKIHLVIILLILTAETYHIIITTGLYH